MMQKEKLAASINKLMELEKNLVPLLNKHISSALFFSGLKKSESGAIMEEFKNKAMTQAKHIDVLKGIKEELARSKNNVF